MSHKNVSKIEARTGMATPTYKGNAPEGRTQRRRSTETSDERCTEKRDPEKKKNSVSVSIKKVNQKEAQNGRKDTTANNETQRQ